MSPSIPTANLTLTYPIYASDFDPANSDFLFLGGGGGEGRSGVKNKITLIDTSRRTEIVEVVDVELPPNEDSVQNLAVAQSEESSAVVFAGINSSSADQEKGTNEHLRSFRLRYPTKRRKDEKAKSETSASQKSSSPTTEALSKAALFTASTAKVKLTYQRILRLTKPNAHQPRVGVIANSDAPEGEIIVFDATNARPDKRDIRKRINLGANKEATDADIIDFDGSGYSLAYCCDHEVFVCNISADKAGTSGEPTSIHQTALPSPAKTPRLKFRFIRFLTPRLLIGVVNIPGWGGAEILLLEVDDKGKNATVLLRKTLHKRIKAATTFAVALLPSQRKGENIQHVIAVGGQDISLTILTLDYNPDSLRNLSFKQHSIYRDLHPIQMTSLVFSTFKLPEIPAKAPPQYLKLASASMSSTVVVQTFPLTPYPSAVAKRKPSDPLVRYTLIPPRPVKGQTPLGLSVIIAVILVAVSAFLLQAFIEIRGATPELLGAKDWLSDSLREKIALPWMFDEAPSLTDKLPPVQSEAQRAYEAVKDSIPENTEDIKAASKETVRKAKNAAGQVKHSVKHHHRRIRDVLSRRAEHLATRLTTDDDDDDEGDEEDLPLFTELFGHDHADEVGSSSTPQSKAIVITDVGSSQKHAVSSELHHSEDDLVKEGKAKKWEDLEEHEKRGWRRKLEDAGVWAAEEGETVLKGIFFSELAGAVAGALRG